MFLTESSLKLNADKTLFPVIDTQRQKKLECFLPMPLVNQHVMPVISTRNLGVKFDDKLNFTEHIYKKKMPDMLLPHS